MMTVETVEAPTEFLYLRHGQTDWNLAGRAQGMTDIPLNATGRMQAEEAAHALQALKIDFIVSSPLSRALETAQIVQSRLQKPLLLEPDLKELGFGALEGATKAAAAQFEAFWRGHYVPQGAETLDAFSQRVTRGLTRALDRPGLCLVVGHGAVWRALSIALAFQPRERLTNAQPVRMRREANAWRRFPLYSGVGADMGKA